ncbi:MAG: hypothetical protein K5673_08315 [Lachnospiraceae bacterium]|nr:hypothetical protein [Lachnospiraceae bacterium]
MKDYPRYPIVFLILISVAYLLITPIGVDMPFHVLRIGELARELSRGSFPVYIYKDLYSYYGYPIPIFYCSFFLYPFAGMVLVGMQPVMAYKLMVIIVLWAVYLISYFCTCRLPVREDIRFEAAFIYTIQPFFLNELFVRASIGAACVFIFILIILVGVYLIYSLDLHGIIWLSVGMAGIIMSHVISAVLVCLSLAVLMAIILIRLSGHRLMIAGCVATAAVGAFLLTAWYICPVMEQMLHYHFKSQTVTGLAVGAEYPLSMFLPIHLVTALNQVFHAELPVSAIGGSPVPVVSLTVFMMLTGYIRKLFRTERILLVSYYLLLIILMLPVLWNSIGHFIAFIQFGWRVFFITSIIGVAISIILMHRFADDRRMRRIIMIVCTCSAVYILVFFFGYYALRNAAPAMVSDKLGHDLKEYTYETVTEDDLYIPDQLDEDCLSMRPREVVLLNRYADGESVPVYSYSCDEDSGMVSFDIPNVKFEGDLIFEIPFIMYDGYTALNILSGRTYGVTAGDTGLVNVHIPSGESGMVEVSYTGTWIQRVSFYISLVSWFIMIYILIRICLLRKANGNNRSSYCR